MQLRRNLRLLNPFTGVPETAGAKCPPRTGATLSGLEVSPGRRSWSCDVYAHRAINIESADSAKSTRPQPDGKSAVAV